MNLIENENVFYQRGGFMERIKNSDGFRQYHTYYSFAILIVIIIASSVLILVFNVDNEFDDQVFLQTPNYPSYAIELTSCNTLSISDTYYYLNNNIGPVSGSCLTITAPNVTVDGLGSYGLLGSDSLGSVGILIKAENVSIKGIIVKDFGNGIDIFNSNKTNISNSDVNSNYVIGLNISGNSSNNEIIKNSFPENDLGILLDKDSYNNKIYDNYIYGLTPPGSNAWGIVSRDTSGNLIKGNNVGIVKVGVAFYSSVNNLIKDTNISDATTNGLHFESINGNNSAENILLINSGIDTVSINSVSYLYMKNVKSKNSGSGFDLSLLNTVGKIVMEDSYLPKYNFLPSGVILRYKKNGFGEIAFLEKINGTGNNLSFDLKLKNNLVEIDSNNLLEFNKSANITLENLGNFAYPEIKRNGSSCPSDVCASLSNLNGNKVMFSVTEWTNYSIGEGTPPGATLSIEEPGEDDEYEVRDFPVDFKVVLNLNGSVWFSLNNGSVNVTMNSTDNRTFLYEKTNMSTGNYTFTAYALVSEYNVERLRDSNDFTVIPNPIIIGNNNTGNQTNNNTLNNIFNNTNVGTGNSNGTTVNINNSNNQTDTDGIELKDVVYWLLVSTLIIAVLIMVVLLVRHLRKRALDNVSEGNPGFYSGLR